MCSSRKAFLEVAPVSTSVYLKMHRRPFPRQKSIFTNFWVTSRTPRSELCRDSKHCHQPPKLRISHQAELADVSSRASPPVLGGESRWWPRLLGHDNACHTEQTCQIQEHDSLVAKRLWEHHARGRFSAFMLLLYMQAFCCSSKVGRVHFWVLSKKSRILRTLSTPDAFMRF